MTIFRINLHVQKPGEEFLLKIFPQAVATAADNLEAAVFAHQGQKEGPYLAPGVAGAFGKTRHGGVQGIAVFDLVDHGKFAADHEAFAPFLVYPPGKKFLDLSAGAGGFAANRLEEGAAAAELREFLMNVAVGYGPEGLAPGVEQNNVKGGQAKFVVEGFIRQGGEDFKNTGTSFTGEAAYSVPFTAKVMVLAILFP